MHINCNDTRGFEGPKLINILRPSNGKITVLWGGGLIIQVMGGGKYTILDNSVFKKIHFYLVCILNGGAVEEF